ncbi:MAG: hypothetical protein AB7N24_15240 [Dehalococcoidia bacterium]
MGALQSFFSTPQRQALGWALLGVLGIAMAAGGLWLLTDDGGNKAAQAERDLSPTATATATARATSTPTRTSTASPTPSPSATPSPTPTKAAVSNPGTSGGGAANQPAAATPTPEPTSAPAAAGGPFCPPTSVGPSSGSLPSGRVAGAVTISGTPAAPNSVELFLAFDGVLGPSAMNLEGAFRIDFFASPSDCANRVGAAISVYANGQYFPTGRSVGDGGDPLIPVTIALP